MDVHAYLRRIDYHGSLEPTATTLAALQGAHLWNVPFENLDVHLGRPIVLALPALYEKIVEHRRGGFCYELNGLFAWLLRELGFDVSLLSGRVFEQGQEGPEFDHLTLAVQAGGEWLTDVGFGDSFLRPLRLDGDDEVAQDSGTFRLRQAGAERMLERSRPAGAPWEPQYVFSLTPRALSDFSAMCRHHQTSPLSTFTRRTICSRATPRGRVTLANERLIVTVDGERSERPIESAREYRGVLRGEFGVELEESADVERLRVPLSLSRVSPQRAAVADPPRFPRSSS